MKVTIHRAKNKIKPYSKFLNKSFLGVSVFIIIIITGINMFMSYRQVTKRIIENKKTEAELINKSLDNIARGVAVAAELVKTDYLIQSLEKKLTKTEEMSLRGYLSYKIMSSNAIISDLQIPFYAMIIGENGFRYTSQTNSKEHDFYYILHSLWFYNAVNNESDTGIITNVEDTRLGADNEYIFVYYENIYSNKKYLGTLLLCVDEKVIKDTYERICDDNNNIYIFGADDRLFGEGINNYRIQIEKEIERFLLSEKLYDVLYGTDGYIMTKHTSEYTKWTVVETVALNSILEYGIDFFSSSMIIGIISVIFVAFLIKHNSDRMTRPLKYFCDSIENNNETVDIEKPKIEIYEIDRLYNSYSIMKRKNKELINGKIENEKLIREQELKFLRAQINPHFLYNTLFSIRCTVDMKKNAEASKMIDLLVDMLRKNLHSDSCLHTISEEAISIKDYVYLARYGYEKKIDIEFEIENGLETYMIMKFLLQPLVENAIFHGIELKFIDGIIRIIIYKSHNKLIVSINDNGCGIDKDTIDRINGTEQKSDFSGHIGVGNVRKRIQENYGDEYGLNIESIVGDGTTIKLVLPLIKGNETLDNN